MCGIVGVMGDLSNQKVRKVFKELLVVDQIRGYDSTGVLAVRAKVNPDKPDFYIEKDLGSAQKLWEDWQSNIFDYFGDSSKEFGVLLGHNRAQTMGSVSTDNAHPFTFGDISGVHNGTLTNWFDLEGWKEFDVDSKALLNTINLKGVRHTWKSFNGAAAVVYWDNNKRTLNIVRNKERPLSAIFTKDRKTMFWASEPWMIVGLCHRNGVELELLDEKTEEIRVQGFEVDRHYQFSLEGGVKFDKVVKLEPAIPFTRALGNAGFQTGVSKGRAKIVTGWKKGMVRGGMQAQGTVLTYLRKISYESGDVYRATVEKTSNPRVGAGYCDIFPHNNTEVEQLEQSLGKNLMVKSSLWKDKNPSLTYPRYAIAACSTYRSQQPANKTLSQKVQDNLDSRFDYVDPPLGYPSYNGINVDAKTMLRHLKEAKDCCAQCQTSITLENVAGTNWHDKQTVICKECTDELKQQLGIPTLNYYH